MLYNPPFLDDMQDHWGYIILDKNKWVFAKDDYVSVDELNGEYTYTLELPLNDYYVKIKDVSSDLWYGKTYSCKIQSRKITTGTEKNGTMYQGKLSWLSIIRSSRGIFITEMM